MTRLTVPPLNQKQPELARDLNETRRLLVFAPERPGARNLRGDYADLCGNAADARRDVSGNANRHRIVAQDVSSRDVPDRDVHEPDLLRNRRSARQSER